ncbi:TIGR01777 family oxidoreductase [Balneola sp. MJW-20]|uniref:TIGR01777 family oxidoreductase n=1 Tax=Gracilimonas aurantiaca TaxID=3234185 RepID=UPI0034663EC8
MNILITGGTGFVGEELRAQLLKKRHELIIITRSASKYEDENARNQRFIGWEDDLVTEMENADVVINLAGENIFGQRWTEEVKKRIMDSRVETTKKLVDAMRDAENPPKVFISASASGIYGDRADDILTEEEPASDDFLAEVCVNWEAAAAPAREFGVRVVHPRIGIVLEKGGGALEKMITPFNLGVGGPVGNGKQYMSWIHRTDLCEALWFPVEHEDLDGAYNVCAPNPVDMNEFAETLADVMNRPNLFRVPRFALDILYGEASKPIMDSIRMQPKKLQVAGFEFRFEDLKEALADII